MTHFWFPLRILAAGLSVVSASIFEPLPDDFNPDVSYFQQNPDAFLNNFGFMNFARKPEDHEEHHPEPEVVSCGDHAHGSLVSWHSADYPNKTSLPAICTLNLSPPSDTCAYRITFEDLVLPPGVTTKDYVCPGHVPSFQMSHSEGVTLPFCSNLTLFEGVAAVNPDDKGPFVMLLTNMNMEFKFKIKVEAVHCNEVKPYEIPSECGIKNNVRRSVTMDRVRNIMRRQEERFRAENNDDEDVDDGDHQEGAITRKDLLKQLKRKEDMVSKGLLRGLQRNQLEFDNRQTRIIGLEAGIGEWPWMTVIKRDASSVPCSGVLIDKKHVMTSASCVLSAKVASVNDLAVVLGEHDLNATNETQTVSVPLSKIVIPFTFDPLLLRDDIAILQLTKPVNFTTKIRPVCLPVEYNDFKDNSGVVSGWDSTNSSGTPISSLLMSPVLVLPEEDCNATIRMMVDGLNNGVASNVDVQDYICAGTDSGNAPVCAVDYGTPLIRRDKTGAYFLAGIAGPHNQCLLDVSTVFTSIASNSKFLNLALV